MSRPRSRFFIWFWLVVLFLLCTSLDKFTARLDRRIKALEAAQHVEKQP